MKKLFCMLLVACMVAISMGTVVMATGENLEVWDGTTEAPQGSGTEGDPYLIANGKNLAWLSNYINTTETSTKRIKTYAKLTNHIVLNSDDVFTKDANGKVTGVADGKTPNAFTPIGSATSYSDSASYLPYRGVFDGAGYEIRNLYISGTANYVGLFGAFDGTLKDLKITSGYITSTANYVGSLVGTSMGWNFSGSGAVTETIISGCYNNATLNGNEYVGGIVGLTGNNAKYVTVEKCINEGSVNASSSGEGAGGIIGCTRHKSVINNCLNTGKLFAKQRMGGLIGYISQNNMTATNSLNMYDFSDVSTKNHKYGLAGRGPTASTTTTVVTNCYSVPISGVTTGVWNNGSSAISTESLTSVSFTYADAAAELATIDMAYKLNDNTSDSVYANSGAWTFVNGATHPSLADSVNGGVYKIEIKNGDTVLNEGDTYVKSTTGTAQLIVSADYGTSADVEAINLKTTKAQDVTLGANWKVMLWDSFDTLKPLRGAIVAQ